MGQSVDLNNLKPKILALKLKLLTKMIKRFKIKNVYRI